MKLPNTVSELIQLLDQNIPEPAPRPGDPSDKIMWDAGRRSVVLMLREWEKGSVPALLREKRGQGRRVHRQDA